MKPIVLTFVGDLTIERFPDVHEALEGAKASRGVPVVVDLSAAGAVDGLVGGEIVLFLHRALRYGATVAVVTPPASVTWLTSASSLREAHFCSTLHEALAILGAG